MLLLPACGLVLGLNGSHIRNLCNKLHLEKDQLNVCEDSNKIFIFSEMPVLYLNLNGFTIASLNRTSQLCFVFQFKQILFR